MTPQQIGETIDYIRTEVGRVLLGQQEVVDHVLVALLAGGHVLLEGVPGLGKTLLVRTLGTVLGCPSKRIQFTTDLMPTDVTGGNVFKQDVDRFEFVPGPVFTSLLLADEINRAPAKTQSALLEAMQERSVTVDGVSRPLPSPFFVLATQNPLESQGTYPLPEAQLDRFLLKIEVDLPSPETERAVVEAHLAGFDPASLAATRLRAIVTPDDLAAMQAGLREINVAPDVLTYITDIVARTRAHHSVLHGASPRGTIALAKAARAHAALDGRDFVTPDDVKTVAPAVLRHRLILQPDAEFEGVSAAVCVDNILQQAPVPRHAA